MRLDAQFVLQVLDSSVTVHVGPPAVHGLHVFAGRLRPSLPISLTLDNGSEFAAYAAMGLLVLVAAPGKAQPTLATKIPAD